MPPPTRMLTIRASSLATGSLGREGAFATQPGARAFRGLRFAPGTAEPRSRDMQSSRVRSWSLAACFTLLLGAASLSPAWAQNNGKRQDGQGKYAMLTAIWWQWAFSQPAVDVGGTNSNPVLDSTGAYAAAGQEDGIGPADRFFFLAGTFGGDAVRTVTVPAGKTLFFPINNWDVDNAVDPQTFF